VVGVDSMPTEYEMLKAEKNRLKAVLDAYSHLKSKPAYSQVKAQYDSVRFKIKTLFRDIHYGK
jgi:hypothetical protein